MKIIKGITKPKGLRIVIYGVHGIGKTTLVSKLPDALFLDYENGTHGIDVAKADEADLPTSFAALNGVFKEFSHDHQGFRNLIIDTADKLEENLDHSYSASLKNSVDSVFTVNDYGRTVSGFTTEFGAMLDNGSKLVESGMNLIVLAHEQSRKKEVLEGTQTYDHSELKLSKGNTKLLMQWADVVIFCAYKTFIVAGDKAKNEKSHAEGGKRWCFTVYSNDWEAKHRACIELPDDCSLDKMSEVLPKAIESAIAPAAPDEKTSKQKTTESHPADCSASPYSAAAQQFLKLLVQYKCPESKMRDYAASRLNDRYGVDFKTLPLEDWPEDALNWLNRGFDKIVPKL